MCSWYNGQVCSNENNLVKNGSLNKKLGKKGMPDIMVELYNLHLYIADG
jgi:hypothetical protein